MLNDVWKASAAPRFDGPALIDTHIWLWYLGGERGTMSAAALRLLQRAAAGRGLLVSDISVWELGTKVAKGRITVAPELSSWLLRAARTPGIHFVPLDREALLASTRLPGEPHGDPADRMLIATAALRSLPLVTADRAIVAYAAAEGGVSVCDARA